MSTQGEIMICGCIKEHEQSPEKCQIEQERDSILSRSSNTCSLINENLSVFSNTTSESVQNDQPETVSVFGSNESGSLGNYDELTILQSELWNLSQQEYYNEKKGLSRQKFSKIKKMKIGKVKKPCSICHSDFIKDEKIMKLPCSHIFHYKCLKTWLNISIYCPLCRLNLKDFFENAENCASDEIINTKHN